MGYLRDQAERLSVVSQEIRAGMSNEGTANFLDRVQDNLMQVLIQRDAPAAPPAQSTEPSDNAVAALSRARAHFMELYGKHADKNQHALAQVYSDAKRGLDEVAGLLGLVRTIPELGWEAPIRAAAPSQSQPAEERYDCDCGICNFCNGGPPPPPAAPQPETREPEDCGCFAITAMLCADVREGSVSEVPCDCECHRRASAPEGDAER